MDGRQGPQQIAVGHGVAVLGDGRGGDPRLGAGVEGREVGHAAHVHPGAEQLGVGHQGREREVAPVRAAHAGHPAGVGDLRAHEVFDAVGHVVDGVEAQGVVVGVEERAPEARGAPDVRREHTDAGRQQPLEERVERRPLLALGAAVQVDHARRAGRPGAVQPAAQLQAVPGVEPDQLGLDGVGEGVVTGHPAVGAGREVAQQDVRGRVGAFPRQDGQRAVQGQPRGADHVGRGRRERPGAALHQVGHLQLGAARDVPDQQGHRAVHADGEPVELGVGALGDHLRSPAHRHRDQRHAVAAGVGADVGHLAVGGQRAEVGGGRQERAFLPEGQVGDRHLALAAGPVAQ